MSQFQIRSCINPEIATVNSEVSISKAERIYLRARTSDLYVVNDSCELLGIVPDYELLKYGWQKRPKGNNICSIMSPVSLTISCNDSIERIVQILSNHIHPKVPVLEERKLLGTVDRFSILKVILNSAISAAETPTDCEQHSNVIPTPKFLQNGKNCGMTKS